jgi:DNA topoisomerase-2
MSHKTEPAITSNARKEEYTRITFKPDLEKFGMTGIDDDIEALLKKRVYDIAGNVRDIKVVLNDERLKVRNFRQYIDLYLTPGNTNELGIASKPTVIHELVNDRWEIAFALSDGQFQQVSFVNSICTYKGGTHVNYIADQLANKLVDAIQKKNKAAPVKAFQIKNHMWLFVNCLIENPTFDSQTKENMTLKTSSFGSKCAVGDEFLNKGNRLLCCII